MTGPATAIDSGHRVTGGSDAKYGALRDALRPHLASGLIIAFSGGVDSAFLLWAAEQERRRTGGRLLALTTVSASYSAAERHDADLFIKMLGVEHLWCESRELEDPAYLANDRSRCFHCKTELFRICHEIATSREYGSIAYGYNASDEGDFRPGHDAAIQAGVLSPLADAGLTKPEIRDLMRLNGLELADKPASPCLSSRLMTGVAITARKLRDVEELEAILRSAGIGVFRVRVHELNGTKLLRIETTPEEMSSVLTIREALVEAALSRGYRWTTLDLIGYQTGGANA